MSIKTKTRIPAWATILSLSSVITILFCFTCSPLTVHANTHVDSHFPNDVVRTLAFGSCHMTKAFHDPPNQTIWHAIDKTKPDTFLWMGDSIYTPAKGTVSPQMLELEYENMLHNKKYGYSTFINNNTPPLGIHGTWDDHDYGGNDRGYEMPQRHERSRLYLDFLGVHRNDSQRRHRDGVYNSVSFGEAPNKVLVLFLDTRWHRENHCIPSLAGLRYLPYGALISCLTRWFTAGVNLYNWSFFESCEKRKVLGEEQWSWLESQLRQSDAQVHIVISSIQVLTTNPAMESWGHFPKEKERLLRLLQGTPGLLLLSGDVHHAELLSAMPKRVNIEEHFLARDKEMSIIEVTSSGLTHSCEMPFYGFLCPLILEAFSAHRFKNESSFYTGRNFGTIEIDWEGYDGNKGDDMKLKNVNPSSIHGPNMKVNIHDTKGNVVLTTGILPLDRDTSMSEEDFISVAKCVDGHLVPSLILYAVYALAYFGIFAICYYFVTKNLKF